MTTSTGTVPRWATLVAVLIPLCVLPSAAWRFHHAVGVLVSGPGPCGVASAGEAIYVASLSVLTMGLALLSLGLVRPWGEVFPRWIPWVGGRAVPRRLGTEAAAFVASVVGLLTAYYLLKDALGWQIVAPRPLPLGCRPPDMDVLIYYVPLIAWAPLLAVLTVHYDRRRRAAEARAGQ